ncbi:hypothetical protein PYCCODRAFT_444519 [Trametes coccinea BRFM310]|uniref:Uncharacterized protein n=1 Tax=Trametes coccinea (strain BRFM310) TaxID=1353009 RepID=A0A1Y2ILX3_TRAC3|nr:hypothetical protein PYCCODRAFT_444519 [Trametes coccinea BRFM310]
MLIASEFDLWHCSSARSNLWLRVPFSLDCTGGSSPSRRLSWDVCSPWTHLTGRLLSSRSPLRSGSVLSTSSSMRQTTTIVNLAPGSLASDNTLSGPSSPEFLFLVLSLSPRRLSASAWSRLLPKLHRKNPETLENDQILTTPDNLEKLDLDSRLASGSVYLI